jgi:hypothetical protein
MGDQYLKANYADPFIRDLVKFVSADSFQTQFETFFLVFKNKRFASRSSFKTIIYIVSIFGDIKLVEN